MTICFPKDRSNQVIPFDGTNGERAENRLSHAWEQVPNPITSIPLPARLVEQLSYDEAMEMAKPPNAFLPKCSKCGCWGAEPAASWKCGEAPRYPRGNV
jgi:hypothetical protein